MAMSLRPHFFGVPCRLNENNTDCGACTTSNAAPADQQPHASVNHSSAHVSAARRRTGARSATDRAVLAGHLDWPRDTTAMMASYNAALYHTRDGTVLPPTMTSRRRLHLHHHHHQQPACTVSVVNMSLAVDADCMQFGIARHQHCYDDVTSPRRRAKRGRRRRRHDDEHDDDAVELMDTLDHVTDDVTRCPPPPAAEQEEGARSGARLLADKTVTWPAKWTSSRYLLTQAARRGDVTRPAVTSPPADTGGGQAASTRRQVTSSQRHQQ